MSCRTPPGRAATRTAAPRADRPRGRLRGVPLLAVLALASACMSTEDEEKLGIHRMEATHYYDSGDYVRAEEQCRAGLELAKGDEMLELQLGFSLLMQATPKKLEEAAEVFGRELGWFGSSDWRLSLGAGMTDQERARLISNDLPNEHDAAKAARMNDRIADLRSSARSNLDRANRSSREKENNAPPELLYHLALLDLDESRYDLYRGHADEAVQLMRTSDKFYAVQIRQQQDDKERARIERARSINAERARRLLKELARIQWGRDPRDVPAAAKSMKMLEEFGPLARPDYFNRGRIYEANGDIEGAVADYEKFLSMSADVADENVTRAVSSLEKLRAKLAETRTSVPAAASR